MQVPPITFEETGEVMTVVMPAASTSGKAIAEGSRASRARSSGVIGFDTSLPSPRSSPFSSPNTPRCVCASTRPGRSVIPRASIRSAPSGMVILSSGPTSVIRSPVKTTVPGSWVCPETVMTAAPMMAVTGSLMWRFYRIRRSWESHLLLPLLP